MFSDFVAFVTEVFMFFDFYSDGCFDWVDGDIDLFFGVFEDGVCFIFAIFAQFFHFFSPLVYGYGLYDSVIAMVIAMRPRVIQRIPANWVSWSLDFRERVPAMMSRMPGIIVGFLLF